MTKEETISNLKAYLDGDTAIGNIIPLRSVLESAIKYLEPSLPANLDEAAGVIVAQLVPTLGQKNEDGSYVKGTRDYFSRDELIGLVKAGVEWLAEQGVVLNLSIDELSCSAYNACVKQGLTSEDDVIIQIRKK